MTDDRLAAIRERQKARAAVRLKGLGWKLAEADVDALLDEVEPLREALTWALDHIADGLSGTPRHDCEFTSNPEKGACDFHEEYWTARAALAGETPKEASK